MSELVERVLPYDGRHSAETVVEAASGLRALVRYLNNATGPWNPAQTLRYAPTVGDVLCGVEAAVDGLDQLFDQLANALDPLADDPTLYDDRRDRPAAGTAREAAGYVRSATRDAAELADALDVASSFTSHLGHDMAAGGEVR